MAGWKSFIIQLDTDQNYFTVLRDGEVYGTPFPSFGTSMEYDVADEVCRRIRDRGYSYAVVCDLRGDPVSGASLKAAQPVSDSKILEYWDDRPTQGDWDAMRAVIAGEDPMVLAARLGITVAELGNRLSEADKRFGLVCDKMHESTQETTELKKINEAEGEKIRARNRERK